MNASVIVHGPQGCGKTRNADAMRRHYGLQQVVEADDIAGRTVPSFGALVLTCDKDAANRMAEHGSLRAVPFTHAARAAGVAQ